MIKHIAFLLVLCVIYLGHPVCAMAAPSNPSNTYHIIEKKAGLSEKKLRKIQRLRAKLLQHPAGDLPDRYIWIGLFGLGLAFCLSFFSLTLGGIVAAAAIACLIIGGIFKLSTL
jgi:hypothetical protein